MAQRNHLESKATRLLAAELDIKYTEALRMLRTSPLTPAEVLRGERPKVLPQTDGKNSADTRVAPATDPDYELILGRPGTGKTTYLRRMEAEARTRGDEYVFIHGSRPESVNGLSTILAGRDGSPPDHIVLIDDAEYFMSPRPGVDETDRQLAVHLARYGHESRSVSVEVATADDSWLLTGSTNLVIASVVVFGWQDDAYPHVTGGWGSIDELVARKGRPASAFAPLYYPRESTDPRLLPPERPILTGSRIPTEDTGMSFESRAGSGVMAAYPSALSLPQPPSKPLVRAQERLGVTFGEYGCLVLGDSGSGKTTVMRALHHDFTRAGRFTHFLSGTDLESFRHFTDFLDQSRNGDKPVLFVDDFDQVPYSDLITGFDDETRLRLSAVFAMDEVKSGLFDGSIFVSMTGNPTTQDIADVPVILTGWQEGPRASAYRDLLGGSEQYGFSRAPRDPRDVVLFESVDQEELTAWMLKEATGLSPVPYHLDAAHPQA